MLRRNGLVGGVEVVDNARCESALMAVFCCWVAILNSLQSSGIRLDVVPADDMRLAVKWVEKHV